MSRTLRLAHRGDARSAPENSLAALLAGAQGERSDGVEFDVRLSADRIPMVVHDPELERVHGRPEVVAASSAAELEAHGVPTLAAVLQALPRHSFLDVELKVPVGPETIEVLASGRGPEIHEAVISSFDVAALEGIANLAPTWPRWLNAVALDAATLDQAQALGCQGISAEWHAIDRQAIAAAARAGLTLAAWTVRRRATFDRLARLGLAAVCVEAAALDG